MFGAERDPAFGHPGAQGAGPIFAMWHKWLGDQWSIGDWAGMRVAAAHELSSHLVGRPWPVDPPQNLREYDPEWGRAFSTGSAVGGCDHDRMLSLVRVPVLFTHHSRHVDAHTGRVQGAISDLQAAMVCEIVTGAGQPIDYRSFPQMGHFMHSQDPELFCRTVFDWHDGLQPKK